jgi:hypothetical protein
MSSSHASVHGAAAKLPPPVNRLNQLLLGQFISRSIYLAADLGVADLLRNGALSITELATRTASSPDGLYRMLRALAAVGVFEEQAGQVFANSELSTYLRRDIAGSLGPMARWLGDASGWAAWGRLDHSIRTGKPAFDEVFGQDCFSWMQGHETSLRVFQEAMTGYTALTSGAVLEAYDFSSARTLLDVGGGHGGLLAQILERVPALQGILLDRPEVIHEARGVLAPLGSRARLVAGNFLEAVPEGADTILLKHIIHDWDDASCAALLANCRRSVSRGARLLVVESILSDEPDAAFAKFLDLEMLVVTPGGRERTTEELTRLLAGAGFELARVVPTQSPVSILEAVAG